MEMTVKVRKEIQEYKYEPFEVEATVSFDVPSDIQEVREKLREMELVLEQEIMAVMDRRLNSAK